MIARRYSLPAHSFFLFGPRGTGKTTWLRHALPDARWFDLLRLQTVLDLSRQPESFRQQVEALPAGNLDGGAFGSVAAGVLDEVSRDSSVACHAATP